MLGTAGSSSVGTAPPNLWDPGTSTGCPWGCLPLLLLCPGCCPQRPRWPPQTLAAFSTSPPLRWGGRAGASGGSTAGTPQRTVQSSGCTFGVGGWGGSRRCLRVVTPLPLEPPSSGHPRSQRARGCPSPGSCVSPLRRPWHNGGTAKPCPGGQAATWREPGPGVGLWLLLGMCCHCPCSGATLHKSESRSGRRRVRGNHTRQSRQRIAFQTQTT